MTTRPPPIGPQSTALALALALCLTADVQAAEPRRLLVAIGNHSGIGGEDRLRYAGSDARRFAAVMMQLGRVKRADAFVVIDKRPQAIAATLRTAASRAASAREDDVELLVYYSGHGSEEHLHLGGERLPLERLQGWLDDVPARLRLLVVDACRSHGGRDKGLERDEAFAIALEGPSGPSGVVTVRSSGPGESAQESDELGGAVFTHYLLSGLRGSADLDGDRRVSFDEAYGFAHRRTLRHSAATAAGPQRAWSDVALEGSGHLVLTHTKAARSTLSLPPGSDVQYFVYALPGGAVMAEAWARPDRSVTVALPAGRFLVQRRTAGQYGAAEIRLPWGGEQALSDGDFEEGPQIQLAQKGGGVVLSRHELTAGYAFLGHDGPGIGHRLRVRYGYRISPRLVAAGGLDLGLATHVAGSSEVTERWVGGDLGVALRLAFSPVELRFGAAALLRGLDQQILDTDAPRLEAAGFDPSPSATAFGGGGEVSAGVWIPLSGPWWLELALAGSALAVPQSGGVAPRLQGGLQLAVGWEL